MEEVVVLGAGFGGLNTAIKIAGRGKQVKLIDSGRYHEFTPGLIDLYRDRVSEDRLKLDIEGFLEHTSIDFLREHVEGIYPTRNVVETDGGRHEYSQLVVALGSEPHSHDVDIREAGIPYSLEQTKTIVDELEEGDSVAVVGSGYVGVEIATELGCKGMEVSLIDKATRPLPESNDKSSGLALDYLNRKGISFQGGRSVVDVSDSRVCFRDSKGMDVDSVLWAAGVRTPEVVRESFGVGDEGIPVNAGMASEEYSNVFAVGDCAHNGCAKTARNAIREAATVAENVDRSEDRELALFNKKTYPVVISLGDTAIFAKGEFAYRHSLIRRLKDVIRMRYWYLLRKLKWKYKIL